MDTVTLATWTTVCPECGEDATSITIPVDDRELGTVETVICLNTKNCGEVKSHWVYQA